MKKEIFKTKSSSQTKKLGEEFAKRLKNIKFIAFYGNLGSGKTTFIQGLAKGLGIQRRITSPTFIIVRRYILKLQNSNSFYHIDLYRTEKGQDLMSLGMDEIIEDKNNIIALEWAEKLDNFLPKKRYEVYLKWLNQREREIEVIEYG